MLEILKPIQPFSISWEVVQHTASTGGGGKGKGPKKPGVVKAMPDWRNPVGFACNTAGTVPAEEHLGVCASVQGLESGASAFVAGATILGLNHLPLLLTTLDPHKWQVQFGFEESTGEVRAIKIMNYEIQLPPETLTYDILWKVNQVRKALLEALTPWEPEEDRSHRGGKGGRAPGQGYIWVGDASHEIAELLAEIWPTPEPVEAKRTKLVWNPGSGEALSEAHQWLQPVAEELDWDAVVATSAPQGQVKDKKGKSKQGGENEGWDRKGVDKKQAKAMRGLCDYLKRQPGQEAKMSALCGRFPVNKKVLAKFQDKVQTNPMKGANEEMVRLVGAQGPSKANKKGGGGGKSGGKGGSAPGWNTNGGKGAAQAASVIERRVEELCRTPGIGCQTGDFDNRMKRFLAVFERRRGKGSLDNAFDMLSEWCCKKDRSSVRSWGSYLMVLLRNWEINEYGASDGEDSS